MIWKICERYPNYEISDTEIIRNAKTQKVIKGVTRNYIEVCLSNNKSNTLSIYTD